MFKLVVLAVVLAAANAGIVPAPLGYAGLGYAGLPLGYAGAALPLAYAGAPLAAPIAPLAAAPLAIAPQAYALPPVREVAEPSIVEQAVEKVEQHGYSIRY
jgi:hypothetical protein